MTQPDLARLEGLVENIGPLPIDPIWMYEAIRHAQRNMDLDVAEGFCEPDRYAGRPIGELINELPALLARVRELEEALEPFADRATELNPNTDDAEWLDSEELGTFQAGHLRRAYLTLNRSETDAG